MPYYCFEVVKLLFFQTTLIVNFIKYDSELNQILYYERLPVNQHLTLGALELSLLLKSSSSSEGMLYIVLS